MDPNTATGWRDLFIGMVGAGASLTGLTFVAIALDPQQIERTPLLRLRAASALWCFVGVMFIGLAVLTPRPFSTVSAVVLGVGGLTGAVLLLVRTVRQRIFQQQHPGATVFRAAGNIFGFVLAGVGGFCFIDVEQGWVFATLALACVIMLSSGIFASWLLVLQIGVPATDKRNDVDPSVVHN
ncbi:MAG TPA: hypothetical protein VNU27_12395 [Candidatus Acidoferrum sp.]|jgi:hypothetical protein|nr:hypothetical protein [Candidatus Angelobacter sp.]HXD82364.1 hypothetical protein [Candidatus Acidoferrum sp.]